MIATAIAKHRRTFQTLVRDPTLDELWNAGYMQETSSGEAVNQERSLGIPAFFSALCLISETIESFPMNYFERAGASTAKLADERLHGLVHDNPNDYTTANIWNLITVIRIILWGNAYDEIEFTKRGEVYACHPIHPSRVSVEPWQSRSDRQATLRLKYHIAGQSTPLDQEEVVHCRGPGDSYIGWSLIRLLRETLGAALALQVHTSRFWKNDAKMSGVLTHDGFLKKDKDAGAKRIEQQFADKISKGLTPMLEGGVKFIPTSMPHDDAQYLGTANLSGVHIAQLTRTPPVMLGLRDAPYAGEEAVTLRFYKHAVTPYVVRIEKERGRKLIPIDQRSNRYFKFNVGGLLRADLKAQAEAFHYGRQDGYLNGDQILEKMDMDPMPDGLGKLYLSPANMEPAEVTREKADRANEIVDALVDGGGFAEEKSDIESDVRHVRSLQAIRAEPITSAFKDAFAGAYRRLARLEADKARRASKKPDAYLQWIDEFSTEHRETIRAELAPLLTAQAAALKRIAGIGRIESVIDSYTDALRARLRTADPELIAMGNELEK